MRLDEISKKYIAVEGAFDDMAKHLGNIPKKGPGRHPNKKDTAGTNYSGEKSNDRNGYGYGVGTSVKRAKNLDQLSGPKKAAKVKEATGDSKFDNMMSNISASTGNLKGKYAEACYDAFEQLEAWFRVHRDKDAYYFDPPGNENGPNIERGRHRYFAKLAHIFKENGVNAAFRSLDSVPSDYAQFLSKIAKEHGLDLYSDVDDSLDDSSDSAPDGSEAVLSDNTPLAAWYDDRNDQEEIKNYIKNKLQLPDKFPLYFDDADLVVYDETVLRRAIYDPKIYMKDAIKAVADYMKTNPSIPGINESIADEDILAWMSRFSRLGNT